MQVPSPTSC